MAVTAPELSILLITAISIGFFHTLLGPDHYLPFIMMAKAGKWTALKTAVVTTLCGAAHVASSVVLGIVGIAFGIAVDKLELFESFRGNIAAWMLIAFGLAYFIWGIRKIFKKKSEEHAHGWPHHHHNSNKKLTPWVLFTIFLFGPCEPLIPILMYPAAKSSPFSVLLVTLAFGLVTILTMLSVVMLSYFGLNRFAHEKMERYIHPLAGLSIFLCGGAIEFLGL